MAVQIATLWNTKAKEWVGGRKNLMQNLQNTIHYQQPIVWIHAASAGELEQAKPVVEALKKKFPSYQILISFFSPSGYKAARNYTPADYITYLPLDTKKNAARFLKVVQPTLVIFSKYDFWYYHLKTITEQKIPLLLISSVFRKEQLFFKWYGNFYRNMLHYFTHIFVQDPTSLQILNDYHIHPCSISGDTRFDRVAAITQNFTEIPFIFSFTGTSNVIVAGSTWKDDEELLAAYLNISSECKLIIAPHEITAGNIARLRNLFQNTILYSELQTSLSATTANVLIIDNTGMLSRLYYYATISYIGGGFTKDGVHNILEAAVYGRPVVFGKNYQKYREAKALIEKKGAFTISNEKELCGLLYQLLNDHNLYHTTCAASQTYVQQNQGATETIIRYIQEKRLLTN